MKFVFIFLLLTSAHAQESADVATGVDSSSVKSIMNITDENITLENLLKLRDPFMRPILKQVVKKITSPLEKFDVSEFEVSAIITGPDKVKAILLDPEGKTHFVKKGDRIGKKEGVIEKITSSRVSVREKDVDYFGKVKKVMTDLVLTEQDSLLNLAPELGYAGEKPKKEAIQGYSSRVPTNPNEMGGDENTYESSDLKKQLTGAQNAGPMGGVPMAPQAPMQKPASNLQQPSPTQATPTPTMAAPVGGREGVQTYVPQYKGTN